MKMIVISDSVVYIFRIDSSSFRLLIVFAVGRHKYLPNLGISSTRSLVEQRVIPYESCEVSIFSLFTSYFLLN